MDLNSAIEIAKTGEHVRDDASMVEGWTVRWVPVEKLFYYFKPKGEKAHKIIFNDRMRASFQWKIVPNPEGK